MPTGAGVAHRAVVSSGSREWTSAIVAQQTPPGAVKTDGRKRRWHQHKVERRNELVDGTLVAIRQRGSNVSMDEIAAEIGVSKTVLYRYFVDKNDLTTAVMMRFAQTTLIPNMAAALSSNLHGYELTREVIRVYVETVAAEPEPYRFVMANNSASKNKVIANSEEIIARMLAVMLRRRMVDVGMDTGGVEPWAYHTVGGVQLATHSWMSHPRMSSRRADRLPDDAVVERALRHRRGGRFPGEVPGNGTPVADPAATVAQEMSKPDELPDLWTHEPHDYLVFRDGDKIARYRHQRHARVQGQQVRRRRPAARAQRTLRRTAGDAVRQQQGAGDNRSVLLVLQGMDTAGKGGIVKHVVGAANPQGIRYHAFGVPTEEERKHHYLWRIRRCAARGRPHRRVRPLALRGRAGGAGARPGAARGVGQALRRDQRVREASSSTPAPRSSRWRCSSRSTSRRSG